MRPRRAPLHPRAPIPSVTTTRAVVLPIMLHAPPRSDEADVRAAVLALWRKLVSGNASFCKDLRRMGALRIDRDGDLLRLTLARPETRNAFDAALIAELSEAFVDVGKARAVVLAGEGPSFCAGADVEWMRASIALDYDANVADANALRRMLEAIDRCPSPVVARVQGHALGGGAGLVACADIAVADRRRSSRSRR